MEPVLKSLYLAGKLEDLNPQLEIPKQPGRTIAQLMKLGETLYKTFEQSLREGDQEKAYVQCGRYIKVIFEVQKHPDYKKDVKYYNLMIGEDKIKGAFKHLDMLSSSLSKRYKELQVSKMLKTLPSSGRLGAKSPISSMKSSENVSKETPLGNDGSITAARLLELLQNPQVGLLIMDCRSKKDFVGSHMTLGSCLNVPEDIIKPGMSAGKLQSELSQDGKTLWASRSIKDHVILMDWNSRSERTNLAVKILKDILTNWDPDADYKNPLLILNDGFEGFQNTYPMHVSNPRFAPTPSPTENDAIDLNEIEYPSMADIKMKDDVPTSSFQLQEQPRRPKIDRTSKAAVLAKTSKIASKFEKTIEEIQEADKKYEETVKIQDSVPESDTKATDKVLTQKIHLNNKIIELEDITENLIKEAEQSLEDQRAVIESVDDDGDPTKVSGSSIDDAASIEEQARLVERMNQKRARLDQERKPLVDQRSKSFEADLEKSRRLEQRNNNNVSIRPVQPVQPTFDRSNKPSLESYEDLMVYRNFNAEPGGEGYGLTGLKNLGNTCYMNSIMQCLSNTTQLKDYFISEEGYRKQFRRTSKTQRQIAEEVSAVMREIWLNKHRHISSIDLRFVIGQCKQIFRGMDQQDSHEFLTILMDSLHLDLQRHNQMSIPNGKQTPSEKAWMDFVKCKESYIMQLFYGQIKSTVKCRVCERESATYEGFSNLSLELPENSNRCNLADCLGMYFYGERISGWNCPTCKQPRDAIKKLDITKLPPILVIHFKRFNVDLDSSVNRYTKKQNFVDFPLTGFNVSEYIAPLERSRLLRNSEYQLYGVSNHYGTMERGHYTAFCKSSYYGKWFKYDDHIVSPMDSSDVRSSAAYILFYSSIDLQRR